MSLHEQLKPLTGNRRRYILMRIAGLDARTSQKICGVVKGTYNTWFKDETFNEMHHRVNELSHEHRQEAIQILRRDNQLDAVLLEGKVIQKMKEEIETGEYALIRTNLARSVYDRLLSDLDVVPQQQGMSWEQKIAILMNPQQGQLPQVHMLEQGGNHDQEPEEVNSIEGEYQESLPIS